MYFAKDGFGHVINYATNDIHCSLNYCIVENVETTLKSIDELGCEVTYEGQTFSIWWNEDGLITNWNELLWDYDIALDFITYYQTGIGCFGTQFEINNDDSNDASSQGSNSKSKSSSD